MERKNDQKTEINKTTGCWRINQKFTVLNEKYCKNLIVTMYKEREKLMNARKCLFFFAYKLKIFALYRDEREKQRYFAQISV